MMRAALKKVSKYRQQMSRFKTLKLVKAMIKQGLTQVF